MTMIFSFPLFLCVFIASSSDDQSLMQQGVGIESAQMSEYKQQVQYIASALKEIQFPGKMRQMAIDALVRSVSKAERLDNATNTTLHTIRDMLETVREEYRGEKAAADQTLLDIVAEMNNCNTRNNQQQLDWAATVGEAKSNFSSCLDTEKDDVTGTSGTENLCSSTKSALDEWRATECADVKQSATTLHGAAIYAHDYHKVQRIFPADDAVTGAGGAMITYDGVNSKVMMSAPAVRTTIEQNIVDASNYYSSVANSLSNELVGACNDAFVTLIAQEALCDLDFHTHVASYCSYSQWLTSTCNVDNACFNTHLAEFNSDAAALVAEANTRIDVIKVINLVDCMIVDLMGGDGVYDYQACYDSVAADNANIVTEYNVTIPPLPARAACVTLTGAKPYEAEWNNEQYNIGSVPAGNWYVLDRRNKPTSQLQAVDC